MNPYKSQTDHRLKTTSLLQNENVVVTDHCPQASLTPSALTKKALGKPWHGDLHATVGRGKYNNTIFIIRLLGFLSSDCLGQIIHFMSFITTTHNLCSPQPWHPFTTLRAFYRSEFFSPLECVCHIALFLVIMKEADDAHGLYSMCSHLSMARSRARTIAWQQRVLMNIWW
jgi:hypothetical protein